jgi:acyl carrier protein phosphodiesterase
MNFLAHLFLAGDTPESLIGNLAGDFVKGPLHDRFTPGIRAGIAEHRKIDSFTDSHPNVAAFRRVLIPDHGHYSRVIADVFFDHFLARSFDEYAGESLESFVERVHSVLDQHADELPGTLPHVYPWMRDQQWLLSYREIAGIHTALARMSHRLSRRPRLEAATHHLIDSRHELERRFRAFFPDVVAFARSLHEASPKS